MKRVRLNFTLVGKSNIWERRLTKEKIAMYDNSARLDFVKHSVYDSFGIDRPVVIANEDKLINCLSYPEFYSAGWFTNEDNNVLSELVVIGHGEDFKSATDSMLGYIQSINWDDVAGVVK